MMKIIKKTIGKTLTLCLFLSAAINFSCRSPQALLKRAIKLDPSILQTDTVVIRDTIKVPEYHDVFTIKKVRDSILIGDTVRVVLRNKDLPSPIKVSMKLIGDDSLYVAVDCPDNLATSRIIYERYTIKPTFWDKVRWGLVGSVVTIILTAVGWFIVNNRR